MNRVTLLLVAALVASVRALTGDTFTVNCSPLTIQRSDPIIFPGIPSAHVHSVAGGNAFTRSMPGNFFANNATATTCNKGLDHSNYWVPQLYHYDPNTQQYTMVKYSGDAHYYQKRACDYAPGRTSCDPNFVPLAFPYGFRMVAGNPYRRTFNASNFAETAITIMCINGGNCGEHAGFPTCPCDQFRSQVYFPSCWNGKDLDTPDHQSHVAYPAIGNYNFGVCPQSHPVALFSLFYEFYFETGVYGDDITHFAFANGDPTGYGYHGDFIMGWTNRDLLQTAHADCITSSDCPTLINQPANPQTLIYPAPNENVGLSAPISSLPGNNSIDWNWAAQWWASRGVHSNPPANSISFKPSNSNKVPVV